ncbi:DedA family protein [Paenibacillus solisilvae]|uniref:DedA family protein n=1 Tax=Paenibacillus solisilvae TaxID=2486751 RepID=A0ABW0VV48_9BACL
MDWISSVAVHLIDTLGIWGIFVGMILESACIPIPSEVILLSGGAAVAIGSMSYTEVVFAGVLGNLIGSIIAYYVGLRGGRVLIERYGKYVLLRSSHFEQAQRWFERYGESTVFFTRNLPFIRTFISLPAGIAGMNFRKFFIFTFLGCIPWNMALVYAGLKLGMNAYLVEDYLHPISYAVAAVVCGLLLFWLFRKKRKHA